MSVTRIHEAIYRITTPYAERRVAFNYLLKGERIALIDTGAVGSPRDVLQPALAEIGLAFSDVDLILITHAHLDHTGGNAEAKELSKAPIYVHSADAPMARSTQVLVDLMTAPLRTLEYPEEVIQQRIHDLWAGCGSGTEVDVELSDGDVVDLGAGITLQAVHCPGHSPGSISFYWPSEGILLAGDAVQGQGPRPGTLPVYLSAPDYRRSMAALLKLDFRMLSLSHSYLGPAAINDPTLVGPDGKEIIEESIQVADTIHRVVAGAVRRMRGASKREMARAAVSELIYQVPVQLVRKTGMPAPAGPMLLSHINSALEDSYPGA